MSAVLSMSSELKDKNDYFNRKGRKMIGSLIKGIIKETVLLPKNIITGICEGISETFEDL